MNLACQVSHNIKSGIGSPFYLTQNSIRGAYPASTLLPDTVNGIGCVKINPWKSRIHQAILDLIGGQVRMSINDQRGNAGNYCCRLGCTSHRNIERVNFIGFVFAYQISACQHRRNHMCAWSNHIWFDERIQSRASRRERSNVIIVPIKRGVIVGKSTNRYHIRVIAWHTNGQWVGTKVSSSYHHYNACCPSLGDSLVERIIPIR